MHRLSAAALARQRRRQARRGGGSSAAGGEGDARLELENEGAAVAKHAHVDVLAARRVEKGGARVEDGDRVAVDALLQGRRRAEGSGRGVGQRIGGGH